MRLVGTVIRSRNVGRQMAVVGTWMEVRRLAFSVSVSFHSRSIFTPQPLRAPGYCRREWAGGRKGRQAHVPNFSRIIFKFGKNIYYPKIWDKLDHGGSASLNMRIMDHLISRPLLTFLTSFFKLKSPNLLHIGRSKHACPYNFRVSS